MYQNYIQQELELEFPTTSEQPKMKVGTPTITAKDHAAIKTMREQNYSYDVIAKKLGFNMNTVKSYCRRRGFVSAGERKTKEEKAKLFVCPHCHQPVVREKGQKRIFCTEACRTKFWSLKRTERKREQCYAP